MDMLMYLRSHVICQVIGHVRAGEWPRATTPTVLNCNQIYDKVSLPDWYNGLQLTDLCLTETQIKAVSYQWWTGKYLIIKQYSTPLVFHNIVKAYFD